MNRPTILVVEDNRHLLQLACEALTRDDCRVRACASGADAIAALDDGPVDLVLSDIHLPGASGLEILQAVREKHPAAWCVLLSGTATEATRARADLLGADALLEKPVDIDRLKGLVADLLSRGPRVALRVLVIEDHPATRDLLRDALAAAGFVAALHADAESGLAAASAASLPFDYALVDINLPGMSGSEAVGRLRQISPRTLLILMTGEATPVQIQEGFKKGGYTLIRKPFDVANVVRCLHDLRDRLNDQRAEEDRKQRWARQPLPVKAWRWCRELLSARSNTRKGAAVQFAVLSLLALLFAFALLKVAIAVDRYLHEGPGSIESFLDRIEGYLRRDEEREIEPGP